LIAAAHWTKRAALLLLALAIGFTVFLTVGAAPASAKDGRQTLIYDQFTLKPGQSRDMDEREPDKTSIGTLWSVELGDWQILGRKGGKVVELTEGWWKYASDKRVNIDAETADVTVSSKIKRRGGYQYFGVTARHSGLVDWLGAWFDPEGWPPNGVSGEACPGGDERCGAIVLGAKDHDLPLPPETADDEFIELERARYKWPKGKTHTISLAVVGNLVTVRVGKKVMIRAEFSGLGDATEVGLFSRGEGETEFENFKATGRDQQEAETAGGQKKPKKPKK